MPRITYISHAGTPTTVEAAAGMTVMRAAVMNNVAGIDADCGGCCACGTCHVIVDPAWADRLPPPDPAEADMLESVTAPQSTSRLSCQITITDALDGLVVTTPEIQG
jgi:2Fe-2S ferredoxin